MKRIHGVNVALRFIRSSRGLGCKTSGGRLLCTDRSGTETFPNKQKCVGYIPGHCLPNCKNERKDFINEKFRKRTDAWKKWNRKYMY